MRILTLNDNAEFRRFGRKRKRPGRRIRRTIGGIASDPRLHAALGAGGTILALKHYAQQEGQPFQARDVLAAGAAGAVIGQTLLTPRSRNRQRRRFF